MKAGDLVNITESRGSGVFLKSTPLGLGLILNIDKTDDITFGSVGTFNLGDDVTVYLCNSGEVAHFMDKSLEVI